MCSTHSVNTPYPKQVMEMGEGSMQLIWHCLVNLSFGYLVLLSLTRVAQQVSALVVPYRRPESHLS